MIIPKEKRTVDNKLHVKLHSVWRSMMGRCYKPKNGSYKHYGNRGVTVVKDWHCYEGFLADVDRLPGYDEGSLLSGKLQLDKDSLVEGNLTYGPDTVCFLTPSDNSGNRRNNKYFVALHLESDVCYITKNREKFCREHNLDSSTIWRMLQKTLGKSMKGRAPSIYKGWTFQYLDNFSVDNLPSKRVFEATNIATGETIQFDNISKFSDEHKVNKSSVTACLKGRQKKVGNFHVRELPEVNYKDSTTIERQLEAYRASRTNQVE